VRNYTGHSGHKAYKLLNINTMDTTLFKQKLEEERRKLETELAEQQILSTNPQPSSQDEMADKFEEMEQNLAIKTAYENRLKAVTAALMRIEDGSYGTCNCGKDIPEERLQADPAAACMCGN
jgi:RNA polymerase-binding transcription factor DksA